MFSSYLMFLTCFSKSLHIFFFSALRGAFSATGLKSLRKPCWFGAVFSVFLRHFPWHLILRVCAQYCIEGEAVELAEADCLPPSMTSKAYFQLVFCGPLHLLPIKLLFLPFCNLRFHFICLLCSSTFINQNARLELISFLYCCASAAIFLSLASH